VKPELISRFKCIVRPRQDFTPGDEMGLGVQGYFHRIVGDLPAERHIGGKKKGIKSKEN
jgi:hypothetical protein